MENPTPFDLNGTLRHWRENLAQAPALRAEEMDELEAHLRDSIQALQERGLSAQEAFWVARARLGEAEALDREFGKVNARQVWLNRGLWMVAGYVGFGILSQLTYAVVHGLNLGAYGLAPAYGLHPNPEVMGLAGLLLRWGLLVGLILLIWRSGMSGQGWVQRAGGWVRRHPLRAAAVVLLCYLATGAGNFGLQMLVIRTVPMSVYGALMSWQSWGVLGSALVWPLLLAWLLMRTSGKAVSR